MGIMGKLQAPAPSYRDDPSMNDALSLHTTRGDYDEDGPDVFDEPPSYTLSATPVNSVDPAPLALLVYNLEPIAYTNEVAILLDPRFDGDPEYAEHCIRKWAKSPPKPMVHIKGTHTETVRNGDKKESKTMTDFDLKLELTQYIIDSPGTDFDTWAQLRTVENGEKAYRGTIIKRRAPGHKQDIEIGNPKPELKEWCHRFCASHARLRSFRLTRAVVGLDEGFIQRHLEDLIRKTNYKGHTRITFPVENCGVEVYSSHRINRWRYNIYITTLCYFLFLWLFTWPYLFFTTKRFAVVRAEWPFSWLAGDGTDGRKSYATISENDWLKLWRKTIEKAVLEKRQGVLGEEDLRGAADGPDEFRSGNETVDTAVGFLAAGFRAVNEVNRQLGWGGDC